MNVLVLGRGKTGSLVEEIARERGHNVTAVDEFTNVNGSAVTGEALANIDVAIDFTTPRAVVANIEACAKSATNLVIGTTGWYDKMPHVQGIVDQYGIGLVFGANFSIGVNIFFDIARSAASALNLGYSGSMLERHHTQKLDKPSGTAVMINKILNEAAGKRVEIESVREGNVMGDHELRFETANDVIFLSHSAKSRRGFAEGAVRAAEWIAGKRGFYDFRNIWRDLR